MVERIGSGRTERSGRVIKIAVIVVLVLIVAAVLSFRFYRTVQTPYWETLSQDGQKVMEQLRLEQISSVERFIGDQVYTVVSATYEEQDVVVWMWDGGHHMKYANQGLSREQIKEIALRENPAKELLRVTPGRLNGEYVWEVFYSLEEPPGVRKYYDYYGFKDGRKLETYRLAIERN